MVRSMYHIPALALLVRVQLALDHANHDLVRDQLALVHDLLSLLAELRLRGDLSAQHVTGSQMAAAELLLDLRRLRSLAYKRSQKVSPLSGIGAKIVGRSIPQAVDIPAPGGPIKIMRMPSRPPETWPFNRDSRSSIFCSSLETVALSVSTVSDMFNDLIAKLDAGPRQQYVVGGGERRINSKEDEK